MPGIVAGLAPKCKGYRDARFGGRTGSGRQAGCCHSTWEEEERQVLTVPSDSGVREQLLSSSCF